MGTADGFPTDSVNDNLAWNNAMFTSAWRCFVATLISVKDTFQVQYDIAVKSFANVVDFVGLPRWLLAGQSVSDFTADAFMMVSDIFYLSYFPLSC